ncbi:MAG: hypothetical protein AAF804_08125 [Bacteroidota bacterium]
MRRDFVRSQGRKTEFGEPNCEVVGVRAPLLSHDAGFVQVEDSEHRKSSQKRNLFFERYLVPHFGTQKNQVFTFGP